MPFVSRAQQRWGHTPAGEKALGGAGAVSEWDSATKGKSIPERVPGHATGGPVANKGYMSKTESFAAGGAVLGRSTDFLKTPDRFRQDGSGRFATPKPESTEDVWGKGNSKANPKGRDKSLTPVKPRG